MTHDMKIGYPIIEYDEMHLRYVSMNIAYITLDEEEVDTLEGFKSLIEELADDECIAVSQVVSDGFGWYPEKSGKVLTEDVIMNKSEVLKLVEIRGFAEDGGGYDDIEDELRSGNVWEISKN